MPWASERQGDDERAWRVPGVEGQTGRHPMPEAARHTQAGR